MKMEEKISYRMYFFVPYNITDKQKGIQCGHAVEQYAAKYGHWENYKDYLVNDKTWIMLDGGTTNNNLDRLGTMQQILHSIMSFNSEYENKYNKMGIRYATFYEPDLNDALSSFCFLVDERVWNYEKYPDYEDYVNEIDTEITPEEWDMMLGDEMNVFLRELLRNKKLA